MPNLDALTREATSYFSWTEMVTALAGGRVARVSASASPELLAAMTAEGLAFELIGPVVAVTFSTRRRAPLPVPEADREVDHPDLGTEGW